MTTLAAPLSSTPYGAPTAFLNVVRSEFSKLFTVRSTYWMLLAAVVFNVGLAAGLAAFVPDALSAEDQAAVDPTRLSLGGIHLSQIVFGMVGVFIITTEYGTGTIRSTLAAIPRRRSVLTAKALVSSAATLAFGIASSFAAFAVFQALLTGDGMRTSLSDTGVLRAVIGGGLYVTVLGLLGLGLGAILRSSAGASAALFGLLFAPPLLVGLLPPAWQADIRPYVPMEAGSQIFIAVAEPGALSPWQGFGIFTVYAVLALIGGFILIRRRDA